MSTVRFRWLRMWWMRQHNLSRLWPICWDCRWARKAEVEGEFYVHDEPLWYLKECMERGEPVEIIAPPTGPNITVSSNGVAYPTPQTYGAGQARVWLQ